MNPPHSTGLRTQTCLDPMKEAAWGARPRTVRAAALLGVRLYDRRPAPICMGGCAAQGVGLGGPSPVARTPGLGDCPPPPARPSRALACKQGVLGLRGEVGWWGEGSNPTPGPPPGYGPKARSASFGCMTGRVWARRGGWGLVAAQRTGTVSCLGRSGYSSHDPFPPGLLGSRAACIPRLAKMPRQPQPAGACHRAPSQPVPRGPRVGGCPVHQWKRLSEQKIAFP